MNTDRFTFSRRSITIRQNLVEKQLVYHITSIQNDNKEYILFNNDIETIHIKLSENLIL